MQPTTITAALALVATSVHAWDTHGFTSDQGNGQHYCTTRSPTLWTDGETLNMCCGPLGGDISTKNPTWINLNKCFGWDPSTRNIVPMVNGNIHDSCSTLIVFWSEEDQSYNLKGEGCPAEMNTGAAMNEWIGWSDGHLRCKTEVGSTDVGVSCCHPDDTECCKQDPQCSG